MHFLTTSTITLSCLVSAAPQADSWWLGHVEPDDVVIADIAGQALKIFPKKKKSEKNLNSPNIMPSFTGPLPVQCGRGRRSGSLADAPQHCSTSEAFSPRTVLTENIDRCVPQIFQHRPSTMPFLTTSTITLSCLASSAHKADSW